MTSKEKILSNGIWVTWEDHRRSRELSQAFGVPYYPLISKRGRAARYLILSLRTIVFILRKRPALVFCQNPSLILTCLLCGAKSFLGFELVVDRHSNFKFKTQTSKHLKWRIFHGLSDYTIRKSTLTVVTNGPLAKIVTDKGGRAAVLPDKLPDVRCSDRVGDLKKGTNFLFICTFSDDEPVEEVLKAFSELGEGYNLYVTGNYSKFSKWKPYSGESNIIFLGFVDEKHYRKYLNSCDATIVLTSMALTLNCGSYESVSAKKPQIVSDSPVIRNYFRMGAIYVPELDKKSIKCSVIKMTSGLEKMTKEQAEFQKMLIEEWSFLFSNAKKSIGL